MKIETLEIILDFFCDRCPLTSDAETEAVFVAYDLKRSLDECKAKGQTDARIECYNSKQNLKPRGIP